MNLDAKKLAFIVGAALVAGGAVTLLVHAWISWHPVGASVLNIAIGAFILAMLDAHNSQRKFP